MLAVALSLGVLLALADGLVAQSCVSAQCLASLSSHPGDLVPKMVQQLEDSVNTDELPNPSVLLALNLAGATDSEAHKWLLHEIESDAVQRAQKDMSSGQVALYVLALLSSCKDPQQVQALDQTLDLVQVLQKKTDEEIAKMDVDGVPITTLFSVSLDVLGLCLAGAAGHQEAAVVLAKELLRSDSISVDSRAVAALALNCTYEGSDVAEVRELLWEVLLGVTTGFLDEQDEGNGLIGNIYSMGLALQALEATRVVYAPRHWDSAQAFSVVCQHHFQLPTATAQLLPALLGKTYLHAAHMDCAARQNPCPQSSLWPQKQSSLSLKLGTTRVHRASVSDIKVQYSIKNQLQGSSFSYSIWVSVPRGSALLSVLRAAAAQEPDIYSFQTEQTSWGPMVTSIHGLAASTNDRTYWQFLGDGVALQEGVGSYKPSDGEHVEAVFSTY
ncbi:cobalamin binding intrinsic factor [Colius striatus]|uniref:cobalamin binding intrinsic factor n=1 Tax=Colius striatus TaxID=57412 RepID=UPI002B1D6A01|nr:cobalamin binding intrinsic factor [Colius striatus]